jgi:hypothetical protein
MIKSESGSLIRMIYYSTRHCMDRHISFVCTLYEVFHQRDLRTFGNTTFEAMTQMQNMKLPINRNA